MALYSTIEWTEATWNPLTGCTKISEGCKNCYAESLARRLKAMGNPSYTNGFKLTLHRHVLDYPLRWRKPHTIFVNSMSDLFHEDVPDEFIFDTFNIMKKAYWHRFQILTKRSERLLELNDRITWQSNIWMGVSIENKDNIFRMSHLRDISAITKFLSLEPLLGPLSNLNLSGIDWVIVGGESGPKSRPMDSSWVVDIRNQCQAANVPFFFKQWGGRNRKKAGHILEGEIWHEMPTVKNLSEAGDKELVTGAGFEPTTFGL